MKNNIKKNYIYNQLYQILNILTPIITTPYISRIILPDQKGMLFNSRAYFSTIIIISSFGVATYGLREIASLNGRDDKSKDLFQKFIEIYNTQIFTTFIAFCLSIIVNLLFYKNEILIINIINSFMIIEMMFNINWFYIGVEKIKVTITRNILIKIFSTILIFLFIKSKNDIYIYASILVFSQIIGNISMFFGLKKLIKKPVISIKSIKLEIISKSIPYMIPMVLSTLYYQSNIMLISFIKGDFSSGIYSQVYSLIRIFMTLVTSLLVVMQPRLTMLYSSSNFVKFRDYFDKAFIYLSFFMILIANGIIIVGDNFVNFFLGENYKSAGIVLQTLAFYPLLFMIERLIIDLILIPTGNEKRLNISTLISFISNIIFSILFIYFFGVIGASFALCFSSISLIIYNLIKFKNKKNILFFFRNLSVFILNSIMTIVIVIYLKQYSDFNDALSFIIYGSIASIIFIIISLMDNKEFRLLFINQFKIIVKNKF